MADSVEGLYQEILGRAPDAAGLAYWNQQVANGATLDQVQQGFLNSQEYHDRLAATGAFTPTKDDPWYGMSWNDLNNKLNTDFGSELSNDQSNVKIVNGSFLGNDKGFQAIYGQADPFASSEAGTLGPDVLQGIRFNDLNNDQLAYTLSPDGNGGIKKTYSQKNGFGDDMMAMASFVATVYGVATGAASLDNFLSGAGTVGATTGTNAAVNAGIESAGKSVGFNAAGIGQAPLSTAPFEGTLGSGTWGLDAVDGLTKLGTMGPGGTFNLGGMTLLPNGELVAAGDLFGATTPWTLPQSSTITDIVVNSSGSVTDLLNGTGPWDQYVKAMGDVSAGEPPAPSGPGGPTSPGPSDSNWWDNVPGIIKDVLPAVIPPLVAGTTGPSGPTTITPTINIPKPEPTAAALQPASSQRAGVKFGHPKSKSQLKGKFSGTGIKL